MDAPIATCGFTAGSVLGRLFADSSVSRSLRYDFSFPAGPGIYGPYRGYFYSRGERCLLCNATEDESAVLTMASAQDGGRLPLVVTLPGRSEYDITRLLQDCAKNRMDSLTITASRLTPYEWADGLPDKLLTLSIAGSDIRVGGGFSPMSSLASVYIDKGFIAIRSPGHRILTVIRLAIDSLAGVVFHNVPGNGADLLQIPLPNRLHENEVLDISLICEMGGFAYLP